MADIIRFPGYVTVAKFPNGSGHEAEITFRQLASANLHPEWRHGPGIGDSSLVVPEREKAIALTVLDPGPRYQAQLDKNTAKGRHRHKTLAAFVRDHRSDITLTMRAAGIMGSINDEARCDYVKNDESLYVWAKSEGVLE